LAARLQVVHLRNLPFDVTLEEIRELCAPWGTIVAMKDKVGGNRNQAFVEFATLEQALAIVKHYQSAVEPAKFRGRPSWLSFSGRDRLTNVAASNDNPTPVLQVTVNNIAVRVARSCCLILCCTLMNKYRCVPGMTAGGVGTVHCSCCDADSPCWCCFDVLQIGHLAWPALVAPPCHVLQPDLQQSVNLDLLNKMFGAYGFVKKLVTYPKPEGGLLAWVQFPDAATAATVGGLSLLAANEAARSSQLMGCWWC
jgi:hypothetical protein